MGTKQAKAQAAAAARALFFEDIDSDTTKGTGAKRAPAHRSHDDRGPAGTPAVEPKRTSASRVRGHGLSPAGDVRGVAQHAITPHVPTPREALVHLIPKTWPAPPAIGDLVFYHGERFWVEWAPPNWEGTLHIRIRDSHVARNSDGRPLFDRLTDKCVSHCVHPDLCTAVPAEYNKRAAKLPTVASIARKERARSGVKDAGDDVAIMLRSCDTLDKIYEAASEYLATPVADLKAKYAHLNNGQQRMNLGNRMRAKWRKEHV